MNNELEFLWWHMRGDFGWASAVIFWITAARLVFKPMTRFLERFVTSQPKAQTAWVTRILSNQLWVFLAFTIDYLASVKLPRARNGNGANFIQKEPPGK
jgi:hypothetical protein